MASETDQTGIVRVIYLYAADDVVGLEMSWVKSVERTDNFRYDEGEKERVGWVSVTGRDTPVYSLTKLFHRPLATKTLTKGGSGRIVVLESNMGVWGLMVDRVSQVTILSATNIHELPSVTLCKTSDMFEGIIMTGDELLLYLAPEKLRPDANNRGKKKNKITAKKEGGVHIPSLPDLRRESAKDNPAPLTRRRVSRDRRSTRRGEDDPDERRSIGYGQVVIFSFTKPKENERPIVFGLSMRQVAEVLGEATIIPVPGAPSFVQGVTNWHGKPTPIILMNELLGLDVSFDDENIRYIVARDRIGDSKGGLLAFPVLEDMRTLDLPIESEPASEILPINYRYIRGVVELADETLVVPDIGGILYESTKQELVLT